MIQTNTLQPSLAASYSTTEHEAKQLIKPEGFSSFYYYCAYKAVSLINTQLISP